MSYPFPDSSFPTMPPKPKYHPRGITIDDELWEFCKRYGRGNASATIRIAVEQFKEQQLSLAKAA